MINRCHVLFYCPSCRHATFHHYKAGFHKIWQLCDFCGDRQLIPMPGAPVFSLVRTVHRVNSAAMERKTLAERIRSRLRDTAERLLPWLNGQSG